MGYVPFDGTLNQMDFQKVKLELNIKFIYLKNTQTIQVTPVDAVVVDIPFKESFNANTREVVKG